MCEVFRFSFYYVLIGRHRLTIIVVVSLLDGLIIAELKSLFVCLFSICFEWACQDF